MQIARKLRATNWTAKQSVFLFIQVRMNSQTIKRSGARLKMESKTGKRDTLDVWGLRALRAWDSYATLTLR